MGITSNTARAGVEASSPDPAGSAEVPIKSVTVQLEIWRGGEQLDDGAHVRLGGAVVEGVAHYQLERPARDGERVYLLNFAEAMFEEPVDLDEVALASYVAGPFRRGQLQVSQIESKEGSLSHTREGERRDLVVRLRPGTRTFTLRYRVVVPRRYWPFGCVSGRCSLSGAIAPLPSLAAQGGRYLRGGRVVQPVRWQLGTVGFGAVPQWHAGESTTDLDAGARTRLGKDTIMVADETLFGGPMEYPSVFWGRAWSAQRTSHLGVEIEVYTVAGRPSGQYPDESLMQLRRDDAGHILAAAKESVALAAQMNLEIPVGATLRVVQGPLRSQVAEFHPGVVTVSDQYLELFPLDRISKFHDTQVARALLEQISHAALVGHVDSSTSLWLPGAVGVAMTKLWQRLRSHRDEYARDLLRSLTFVPAVDRLLYTGQANFSSAYFRGSEDQFPVRNHPLWFSHELPTGRRIHEKLADLMDERQLGSFYVDLASRRQEVIEAGDGSTLLDVRGLVEGRYGYSLDWFFDQWLGPYPEVDYVVEWVKSRRVGDHFETQIVVLRDGEVGVVEPVQVLVRERDGTKHYLLWNGDTGKKSLDEQPSVVRHRWVLVTESRVHVVRLDPRFRLVESPRYRRHPWNLGDNNDPRFNNRDPHKFRFLYTGFGLSIAASELSRARTAVARINAISASAMFETSLQRDLRRTGIFYLFKDREATWGVGGAVSFYFLRKMNRRRRRLRLTAGLGVSQVSDRALDPIGGVRLIQDLRLVDDTRRFMLWPERGHKLSIKFSGSEVLEEHDGRRDDRFYLRVSAKWTQLWRIARGHVFATHFQATVGAPIRSRAEYRSLQRAGGLGGLRGFAADELFGRGVAYGLAEYRHQFMGDLRVNLGNLAWWRTLGGTLFGGVAAVSSCEKLNDWFSDKSWYGQVGYGVTAGVQLLGVTPQFFRLDAAVPIGRRLGRQCLDETFPSYLAEVQGLDPEKGTRLLPPFNINLTFNQPF